MLTANIKNIRKILLFGFLGLFFALLLTVSFGSSSANAQSIYDDHIKTVPIDSYMPCTLRELEFDLTVHWGEVFISRMEYLLINGTQQQIDQASEALSWLQSGSGYWITRDYNDPSHVRLHIAHPDSQFNFAVNGSYTSGSGLHYFEAIELLSSQSHYYTFNFLQRGSNTNDCHNANFPSTIEDWRNGVIESGRYTSFVRFTLNSVPSQGSSSWANYAEPSFGLGFYQNRQGFSPQETITGFHFIASDNVTYPSGYEGETIPDSSAPPIEYEQTPDWYVSEAIDWEVQIHDSNFNTFDEIQWTCNEGLAPVLYYEVWSVDDNVKLLDGYHNATAQINWQAPQVDELRMYEVKGKYFCGDEPDDPQFPHFSTRGFAISEHGMLDFTPYYQCMTDEAPYVDFEACIASFERFINQLSFGAVGYSNDWSYQAECHHLGILGDWINVPNSSRQVCPQFSSQVRNIITPFVTFILGLMTITFIASRGEHGTRKDDI